MSDTSPRQVSNGNVASFGDVTANLEATGADGIMSAEAVLADPLLFQGGAKGREEVCGVALEYLALCLSHDTPASVASQHLHYMLGRRGRGGDTSPMGGGGGGGGILTTPLSSSQATPYLSAITGATAVEWTSNGRLTMQSQSLIWSLWCIRV